MLVVQESIMVCSGRDHVPARILHIHDTVPLDAERPDTRAIQSSAGHRLDRASPNLCDVHGFTL
jgi:hypothetical protein